MWSFDWSELHGGRGRHLSLQAQGRPAPCSAVIAAWKNDADFRARFSQALAEAPYSAFRWETPSLTKTTLDRPFECVLVDSPSLAAHPDANAFAEHFSKDSSVIEFSNLGGDAILVVPCPRADHDAYNHLATFLRRAPDDQRHELWQRVAGALERRLEKNTQRVWLSTAGAGVSWLHVRLDDRPKYYNHAPYAAK